MKLTQLINRFATVPIVGVDFDPVSVRVVELAPKDDHVAVRRAAAALVNGLGAVDAFKQLVAQLDVRATRAAVSLAAPQIIVKPFAFPSMPKKELAKAVQLEAEQEIMSGHGHEMTVDWHLLPSRTNALRGLYAVVPKTTVAARLATIRQAGLQPVVVDIAGLALWNGFWTLVGSQEASPKTWMLLHVGRRWTNVVIVTSPDTLLLTRDVQIGSDLVAAGRMDELISEIQDSLGYARAQGGLRNLDAVALSGEGSLQPVMDKLSALVPCPVTAWNPLDHLPWEAPTPLPDSAQGSSFAIAVGLALRQPS